MDKRGIHWQEIATALMVIAVILVVIFVFNSESRAEFKKLVGIREAVTGYKLPELGLLTPSEAAKAERTPEGRKALCQAEFDAAKQAFNAGDYKSAIEKYKKFLDETLVKLGSDCPSGLSDIAKQGLEEVRFRYVGTLIIRLEKVMEYNRFIKDYPNSKFLGEVYFKLGNLHTGLEGSGVTNYAKADENYRKAATYGYDSREINAALAHLEDVKKYPGGEVGHSIALDEFRELSSLVNSYLAKGDLNKALEELKKAERMVAEKEVILSEDKTKAFNQLRVNTYRSNLGTFDEAVRIFLELKSQNLPTEDIKSIRKVLGDYYYKQLTIYPQTVSVAGEERLGAFKVYGHTGIGLREYKNGKAVICAYYGDFDLYNWRELDCNEFGLTGDKYVPLSRYPLVAVNVLDLNRYDGAGNYATKVKARVFDFDVVKKPQLIEEDKKIEVFPSSGLYVLYDGYDGGGDTLTELFFYGSAGDEICSIRWRYFSPSPGDVQGSCTELPSLSLQPISYEARGGLDYVTVEFTYTP